MKLSIIALTLTTLTTSCGFVDADIHQSDEELEARQEVDHVSSTGLGVSGSASVGCGSAVGWTTSDYTPLGALVGPSFTTASTPSTYEISPSQVLTVGGTGETEQPPLQSSAVTPASAKTWGQMLEWELEQAYERGEVDRATSRALASFPD